MSEWGPESEHDVPPSGLSDLDAARWEGKRLMLVASRQSADLAAARLEIERLWKVVKFYAVPEMWMETKLTAQTGTDGSIYMVAVPVLLEMGRMAREALAAAQAPTAATGAQADA